MLTLNDKKAIEKTLRHSRLVDKSRKLARIVTHTDPTAKIKAVRTRLEKSIEKWIKYFGGAAFEKPFCEGHKKTVEKIERAVKEGGLFAFAMPRGHGKTTILKWAILKILLCGDRKYVVTLAATAQLAQSIIDFVRQQITENDKLFEHYPHVAQYARMTDGKSIKSRFQLRADGKPSGLLWSKNALIFPDVVDARGRSYPSNGAILEAHGLTGAFRGKWKDSKTGAVIRPDFILLDDPQDRSSAESPTQCDFRERIITGDILGLSGIGKRISAVMPCTIIRKGDLADRFLSHEAHPEWQGEICRLVEKWPDEQDGLWAEYVKIYREETSQGRGFAAATDFYKKNKEQMDAGAEVSWAERIRDGEISALQTAENMLLEMGIQFWAEMQNDPKEVFEATYRITPEQICEHIAPLGFGVIPERASILVAASDINRTKGGLHWVVVSFDQSFSAHVSAYGTYPESGEVWPKNAPDTQRKQMLYSALSGLSKFLMSVPLYRSGQRIWPSKLLIDRGYEPEVVHRFCQQGGCRFALIPARGYAAQKYSPRKELLVGAPLEHAHRTRSQFGDFVAFNADAVREIMQRAWTGDVGAPGGATLFSSEQLRHREFGDQVSAEILKQKYLTDYGMRYEWVHQPGARWDWGDAMSMAYVGAMITGLTSSGLPVKTKYVERRRSKIDAKI